MSVSLNESISLILLEFLIIWKLYGTRRLYIPSPSEGRGHRFESCRVRHSSP